MPVTVETRSGKKAAAMAVPGESPRAEERADRVHVFGVRHLSPAGAWHLLRFLDRVQPRVVLIEGPSDANDLIPDIVRSDSQPPIAILAYTDSLPVRTILYPLAAYSPEYQALKWATSHGAKVEFIDLPSAIFLGLQDQQVLQAKRKAERVEAEEAGEPAAGEQADEPPAVPEVTGAAPEESRGSLYDRYAQAAGETDYETYWERHFEHNLNDHSYRLAIYEFGRGLRSFDRERTPWRAENLVREAFMRRKIQETLAAGYAPHEIVAVVGAFHAPVLQVEEPRPDDEFEEPRTAMTDEELARLPRRSSKWTLMPYSYFRLSSQSGYGAGNRAPAYFELLWQALQKQDLHELPTRYVSLIARVQREAGTHRSTAEVIEAVRLARTLSAMAGGQAPTLADLRDAAVTLIGHGEIAPLRDAFARVEVGTAIGRLPHGVSQTSIQDDFERELTRLKLEKYRTGVKHELSLDLRENRRVNSEEAAFLDLNRSTFLHRLRVLGIEFAVPLRSGQQATDWAEKWRVQWTPESEIQLVEAVLLGETVELAVAFRFDAQVAAAATVADAAGLIRDACLCELGAALERARRRLQELSAETGDFAAIANAANQLGMIVRYGDVRRFDPSPLLPLIDDLFIQGSLALHAAANCDNAAAAALQIGMDELNKVNLEFHERVDESLWIGELKKLSDADDRNPLLSGYACAILLERGLISNDDLAREVSRRLSPGIAADLGAGWFEGLSKRNRYALLARQLLWEQLASYVAGLDEDQFRRAIVFLRRAFGGFSPREKRQIGENLGEYWKINPDVASELLETELTAEEQQKLTELNEFDFGDL